MVASLNRKLNWRRKPYDARDHRFRPKLAAEALPAKFEIPGPTPPIYDQLNEGSCTAWQPKRAVVRWDMMDSVANDYATQFLYYNERVLEGTVNEDSGAYIADSIKALNKWGVCPEAQHPYLSPDAGGRGGNLFAKPSDQAYASALHYQAIEYQAVNQRLADIKNAVYDGGTGNYCIIGFDVYSNFWEIRADGILTMPSNSYTLEGGHAVSVVGWDDAMRMFKMVNQWGPDWGDHGYFYMPYDYLLDPKLAGDFWTISRVSGVDNVEPAPPPPTPPAPGPSVGPQLAITRTGYHCLYINDAKVSRHVLEQEGHEHAVNALLNEPTAKVRLKPEFDVAYAWK